MKKIFLLTTIFLCFCVNTGWAETANPSNTIGTALKKGKISGTIGNYFEFTNKDADNSDFGWSTTYLLLKYETLPWNKLKFGASFLAHGQTYSDQEDEVTDPFDTDIESETTLPELYLDYSFGKGSSVRAGRYAHKKISHIDDSHSEGGYLILKEIPNIELIAGVMTRFAELDYDDGEDFGRANDAQDLDSATFGDGAGAYLFYFEGRTTLLKDKLYINPYIMTQNDYASVYGLDTKIETKLEDQRITLGSKIGFYYVDSDAINTGDSLSWSIFPYLKKGYFELTIGYAAFDDGDALNKPAWLADYFSILDQQKEYGQTGSQKYQGKIKFTKDKFWAHYAIGDNYYDFSPTAGDRSIENELQFGYNFTKNFDVNIRLFDVQYDNVDDKDYQKIETRIRFKF